MKVPQKTRRRKMRKRTMKMKKWKTLHDVVKDFLRGNNNIVKSMI